MSYQFTIRYEISESGNHNEDQKKILFFFEKKVLRMSRFVQKLNKKNFLAYIFTKKYLDKFGPCEMSTYVLLIHYRY